MDLSTFSLKELKMLRNDVDKAITSFEARKKREALAEARHILNDEEANNKTRITGRRLQKRFANGLVIWLQGRNITNLPLLIGVPFSVISRSLKQLHRRRRRRQRTRRHQVRRRRRGQHGLCVCRVGPRHGRPRRTRVRRRRYRHLRRRRRPHTHRRCHVRHRPGWLRPAVRRRLHKRGVGTPDRRRRVHSRRRLHVGNHWGCCDPDCQRRLVGAVW